jgi:dihydrofolate reductase
MSTTNKIIVWMQVSLDGRASGPNGVFDWPVVGPELSVNFLDGLRGAGLFVYGAEVYRGMAAYWPTADEQPDADDYQVAFSRVWKPMPKLVFSRSLDTTEWNTTVSADVHAIRESAENADGDAYVFGGATVVGELVRRDLIDEYQLFVHPVVLGGGTPLFPDLGERQQVRLADSRIYDGSVISMHYVRER